MHSYNEVESPQGSHFFIKSPEECQYLMLLRETEEEYMVDFLEENIHNCILNKFTVDQKPLFCESDGLFDIVKQIIFNYVNSNDVVVKIEFNADRSRKTLIEKYFAVRPPNVKGLTHIVNGNAVYYFFNDKRISSTELISALVTEFNGDDENDEEE